MAVKVAINGFGRIGRLAFRQMFGAEGYEVVAINDLTSPKMLAHLLKYDSTQGTYALADKVEAGEDSITVDGKEIKIYAKANAAELPWGEIGVDVVLECTGFYTSKAKAQAHIDAGAKKVVISAPAGLWGWYLPFWRVFCWGCSMGCLWSSLRVTNSSLVWR